MLKTTAIFSVSVLLNYNCTDTTLILSGYSRELANNCTVLHSSVLYCIKREGWKREKWENLQTKNKEQTDRQTDVSTTESTLILFGSSPDTRGSWPIIPHNNSLPPSPSTVRSRDHTFVSASILTTYNL